MAKLSKILTLLVSASIVTSGGLYAQSLRYNDSGANNDGDTTGGAYRESTDPGIILATDGTLPPTSAGVPADLNSPPATPETASNANSAAAATNNDMGQTGALPMPPADNSTASTMPADMNAAPATNPAVTPDSSYGNTTYGSTPSTTASTTSADTMTSPAPASGNNVITERPARADRN